MLNPTIFIFTQNFQNISPADVLNPLHRNGFAPMVDAIHGTDLAWFDNNMKCPHTLFSEEGVSFAFDGRESFKTHLPIMCVCFNQNDDVVDWSPINGFFKSVCFGVNFSPEVLEKGDKMLARPVVCKEVEKVSFDQETDKMESDHYGFRKLYSQERDVMIYEIVKPFTDKPYVTLTRNFKTRGHLPFFSSLFICNSWGVCRDDIGFLAHLWKHFGMDGDFDCESVVSARIEACTPGEGRQPESEPEVYRNTLENVLIILDRKEQGLYCQH